MESSDYDCDDDWSDDDDNEATPERNASYMGTSEDNDQRELFLVS